MIWDYTNPNQRKLLLKKGAKNAYLQILIPFTV